jgi:hypothetical protein
MFVSIFIFCLYRVCFSCPKGLTHDGNLTRCHGGSGEHGFKKKLRSKGYRNTSCSVQLQICICCPNCCCWSHSLLFATRSLLSTPPMVLSKALIAVLASNVFWAFRMRQRSALRIPGGSLHGILCMLPPSFLMAARKTAPFQVRHSNTTF